MRTRFLLLTLSAVTIAAPVFAQGGRAPAPLKPLATAAKIQAAIAKAEAEHKPGDLTKNEPLASVPPNRYTLEDRFLPNVATIHSNFNEVFYFVQGTGTIMTGGTLVNPHPNGATDTQGTAIQGGTQVTVSKGDLFIVPAGTPHVLTPVGGSLVDIVIRQEVAPAAPQQ